MNKYTVKMQSCNNSEDVSSIAFHDSILADDWGDV